ncbi:hypothetical protein ADL26_09440 [Thermoactinomyces vulgaris]|nr:hypothetical protein ADL26_09440 [Thermoactinomyces vulgaris]
MCPLHRIVARGRVFPLISTVKGLPRRFDPRARFAKHVQDGMDWVLIFLKGEMMFHQISRVIEIEIIIEIV